MVVIDCSAIFDLEYTALKMLTQGENKLRQRGITLWLAGLNPQVLAVVRHSPLGEILGNERLCFNVGIAVERYEAMTSATDIT